MHYQELINSYSAQVDVESGTWLLSILTKYTEESLLVQIKQTFDTFSDAQKVCLCDGDSLQLNWCS